MAKKIKLSYKTKKPKSDITSIKISITEKVCEEELSDYSTGAVLHDVDTILEYVRESVFKKFWIKNYQRTETNLALVNKIIEKWRPKFEAKYRRLIPHQRNREERILREEEKRKEKLHKEKSERDKKYNEIWDCFREVFTEYFDDSILEFSSSYLIEENNQLGAQFAFDIKKSIFFEQIFEDMAAFYGRLLDYKLEITRFDFSKEVMTFYVIVMKKRK